MVIHSFKIIYNAGVIGPAWSLEGALDVARDLVMSGFQVRQIIQGAAIVLEGDELQARL